MAINFNYKNNKDNDTVLSILKGIGQAHNSINYSEYGVLENLNFGEITYPITFFVVTNVERIKSEKHYNIVMLVCDLVDDDVLQQHTIHNQTLKITDDIVQYLKLNDPTMPWDIVTDSIISTPFIDKLPDYVAGWQTEFKFIVAASMQGCELPFTFEEEENG